MGSNIIDSGSESTLSVNYLDCVGKSNTNDEDIVKRLFILLPSIAAQNRDFCMVLQLRIFMFNSVRGIRNGKDSVKLVRITHEST